MHTYRFVINVDLQRVQMSKTLKRIYEYFYQLYTESRVVITKIFKRNLQML